MDHIFGGSDSAGTCTVRYHGNHQFYKVAIAMYCTPGYIILPYYKCTARIHNHQVFRV